MQLDQIRPSRRKDLIVVKRDSAARNHWVIKDPVQLNYFILDEFQYWLFCRLNGRNSITAIADAFNRYYSPIRSSAEDVLAFCMQMSRDSLLNETVDGSTIQKRRDARNRGRWMKIPMSLLSIRLPSMNARWFFDLAEFFGAGLFSPFAIVLTLVLFCFAGIVGVQNAAALVNELPFLGQIRAVDVVSFLIAMSMVKILHELGHAICCRRLGAECNELGIMFLVFSPCLYCNVTDSWILSKRWKRIAVVSAGIYVELIIASLAILGWHFCELPLLRMFFLNLVIVCSVSTLLVNGNPLMRYDGYFILSDLVDIPNLSDKARKVSWELLANVLFHIRTKENDPFQPSTRAFLVVYYLMSVAYRWFILIAIFWLAYSSLKSWGLTTFAIGVATVYGAMIGLAFCFAFSGFLMQKNKREKKRWPGILFVLGIIVGCGYLGTQYRVQRDVHADAMIELAEYQYVSVQVGGTLTWTAPAKSKVNAGDTIATLQSDELGQQLKKLEHEKRLIGLRIDNIETLISVDEKAEYELPELRARQVDLDRQIAKLNVQKNRLKIIASTDGEMIDWNAEDPRATQSPMQGWEGSLLDPKNQGCFVESGTTLCLIGKSGRFRVQLLIDERKMDLVNLGDQVRILLPTQPGKVLVGEIEQFSRDEVITRGAQGDASRDLEAASKWQGKNQVRAIVKLREPLPFSFHGVRGKADILIANETVGQIVKRFLVETFRFEL